MCGAENETTTLYNRGTDFVSSVSFNPDGSKFAATNVLSHVLHLSRETRGFGCAELLIGDMHKR